MIPAYQTNTTDNRTGDCMRACIASIFEMDVLDIPNFWEQTQDKDTFWGLLNSWMAKNTGFTCLTITTQDDPVRDILCVAVSKVGGRDHAVVWRNEVLHNPNPKLRDFKFEPEKFIILIPLDPMGILITSNTRKNRGISMIVSG